MYVLCREQGCAGRPSIPRGGAGRGKGKNPQGGAKVKIRGAGRGEKARKLTNCVNVSMSMCQLNHELVKVKELFIFLLYFQKHVLLSLWRLHNVHIIFTIHL